MFVNVVCSETGMASKSGRKDTIQARTWQWRDLIPVIKLQVASVSADNLFLKSLKRSILSRIHFEEIFQKIASFWFGPCAFCVVDIWSILTILRPVRLMSLLIFV